MAYTCSRNLTSQFAVSNSGLRNISPCASPSCILHEFFFPLDSSGNMRGYRLDSKNEFCTSPSSYSRQTTEIGSFPMPTLTKEEESRGQDAINGRTQPGPNGTPALHDSYPTRTVSIVDAATQTQTTLSDLFSLDHNKASASVQQDHLSPYEIPLPTSGSATPYDSHLSLANTGD